MECDQESLGAPLDKSWLELCGAVQYGSVLNMFWTTATSQTSSEEEMKDFDAVKPTVWLKSGV